MEDASERLKRLIAKFVLRYNYWGYLFSRIRRKEVNNLPSIMGVAPELDGSISLLYNKKMIDNTNDDNIIKVIKHEGLHLLNKHIPRLIRIISNEINNNNKQYKCNIWNIAADCTVNSQGNFSGDLFIDGKRWPLCFPENYNLQSDQVTEKNYLDLLEQNNKKQNKKKENQNKQNKKDDKSQNKQNQNKQDKKDNKSQNKQNQNKQDKKDDKSQNNKGQNKQNQNRQDNGTPKPNIGDHKQWIEGCKGTPDLGTLSKKVDAYINRIIKDSIKTFNKDRGKTPGYISDLINQALTPPQLPYYQIIKKLVTGSRFAKFKRSPTRINRKRTYSFIFADDKTIPQISPFPGKVRDRTFDIVIILDTSGSMKIDEIKEGLSGIKSIIEKDRYCKTTVLEVDTQIAKEYECKKIKDIQFDIKGRGGTTLGPGLFRAKQLLCDVCLVFTDGYTENINNYPRKKLPKKIVWVINNNGTIKNLNKTGVVVKVGTIKNLNKTGVVVKVT